MASTSHTTVAAEPLSTTDRRATPTPGLDPTGQSAPELPTPITADEVSPTPPDRASHAADATTDVSLTFERS